MAEPPGLTGPPLSAAVSGAGRSATAERPCDGNGDGNGPGYRRRAGGDAAATTRPDWKPGRAEASRRPGGGAGAGTAGDSPAGVPVRSRVGAGVYRAGAGAAVLVAGALPSRRARRELRRAEGDERPDGRFRLVYDSARPRVRLGVLWFVVALLALRLGPLAVALVYGAVAGVAGLQTAYAWRRRRPRPVRPLAGLVGLALPLVALGGSRALGAAVIVAVVAALALAASAPGRRLAGVGSAARPRAGSEAAEPADPADAAARRPLTLAGVLAAGGPVEAASASLRSGLFVGLAAASLVLVRKADAGAALAVLLLVSAYEVGDYLVGTGSATALEGPAAGMIGALVVTFALALFPPSAGHGTMSMWLLGLLTAVGCPLGQLAGSALLPSGGSFAPALRRLDSLLVVAPLWAVVVLRWWT